MPDTIETLDRLRQALAGRYVIERELGRGGMAVVYLARDVKHDRAVAIKVVRAEIAATLGADRFLREIGIAAHLQHPNILTLIDSGEADGALYYVMPFVEGESLREQLRRPGRLSVTDSARILHDVLDALGYAHQQGVVHRDIKPDNVMLSGRHAFVMDFGVAKAASAAQAPADAGGTLTVLGVAIGTPAYMSPEQASGQATLDARSDLYSVGVMAYEMLAGTAPFSGENPQAIFAAQVTRTPEALASVRPDVPEPFARAIMRALEKNPADRPPSAEALLAEIEPYSTPSGTAARAAATLPRKTHARALALGAGALVLIAAAAGFWSGPGRRMREARWAREKGLPELLALGEAGEWDSAYILARRVEAAIPGDSLFNAMRPRFARRASLHTTPPGATVKWKEYSDPSSAWNLLGKTPLDSVLLPLSASGWIQPTRIQITAPGMRTLDLIWLPFGDSVHLDKDGDIPPEMVRVGGGTLNLEFTVGFTQLPSLRLSDFLMDRFEVTNSDFRKFVNGGGYRRRELWEFPFTKGGATIPWEEAMALMVDRTGRPGPASWEGGDFPEGQGDFPVGGVSWYEAAAYAKFVGKSLPTLWHWYRAATVQYAASVIPASNFSGNGPVKVGSRDDITAFGTYDMAGNVREWCLNASGADRFILGGGWNDQPYSFTDAFTQPPFDRSPTNGIRLVKYLQADSSFARASAPMHRSVRDYNKERPASAELVAAYRQAYEYDRSPLNPAMMEKVDEGEWTRELVSVDAAYPGDRLLIYLYLPKLGVKPYPAIIYYPGSNAIRDNAPKNLQWRSFNFMLKSGRAVIYPVYKGTYQRSDSLYSDVGDRSTFYRDHVVMWGKDLRRAIDYAETRPELGLDHLAYYGVSWGGQMGGLMPAIEPRIKVNVLYVAGLGLEETRPEVDPFNFLPQIKQPTLMLNGRYDFFFPIDAAQMPMFRNLGTPPDQKRHVIEDGSHFVPRAVLIQESLAWLDKYQPLPH
ncbi:MAG TPA: protein kinase [Gemmatimonadaceae bacterium]|nr:protein kinase [Gemmatimonadaceae bacterium]